MDFIVIKPKLYPSREQNYNFLNLSPNQYHEALGIFSVYCKIVLLSPPPNCLLMAAFYSSILWPEKTHGKGPRLSGADLIVIMRPLVMKMNSCKLPLSQENSPTVLDDREFSCPKDSAHGGINTLPFKILFAQ